MIGMSRFSTLAAIAVALLVSSFVWADVFIEKAGFKQDIALPDYADVSGISWKDGCSFYVVRDGGSNKTNGCRLHVMNVPLDEEGRLFDPPTMSEGIPLVGAHDAEGIAYDPHSRTVWIADEVGARISEYDPETGEPTGREVSVPEFVSQNVRGNLSLESLSMSRDGLTLWTANEEALKCDGDVARPDNSTVVRLMRFTRSSAMDDWAADGMWAYVCDPVGWNEPVNSGVSDLCALPDGSLLVLERECSYGTLGRTRIYRPDFTDATDISGCLALTNATYAAVRKGEPLFDRRDGRRFGDGFLRAKVACYEGLCLGPENADGTMNLMLVSDGGAIERKSAFYLTARARTIPFVRSLSLHGLKEDDSASKVPHGVSPNRMGNRLTRIHYRPWCMSVGGFGRGGIRTETNGRGSDRLSLYGVEADLQYGLLKYGPYDLWMDVGGSYCPRQGSAFGGTGSLGYGECRLMLLPRWRVTESFAMGLRLGAAFDWLNGKTAYDSETRFVAQGILGVQATYLLTEHLGVYADFDWRLGGKAPFGPGTDSASVDMSGWFWSTGVFWSF